VIPPAATGAGTSRPSLSRWSGRGATLGFRWTSDVVGSAVSLALVPILALTAFELGSGRGWGVSAVVPSALVLCHSSNFG